MSARRVGQVETQVEALLQERALTVLPDGQLLERFARLRDEAAFAALLHRHGPMVLGVCRGILRHGHDAEDAFQAAFLVLACKAGEARALHSVGGWLHGIACRVALKARARAARHRAVEHTAAEWRKRTAGADEKQPGAEWLHEELGRLPEPYRRVLVLCHLEGKTQAQAAEELGCPPGSVSRHLKRGEELLRERLRSRGLAAPPAGAALAGVPALLTRGTLDVVDKYVTGTTLAQGMAPEAVALAREVLKAMTSFKLKAIGAAVLLLGVIAAGAALSAGLQPGGQPEPKALPGDGPRAAEVEPVAGKDRHGDPLPDGAVMRLGTVRLRQGETVRAMTFSPDGKLLATAGGDGTVRVWSVASAKELARAVKQNTNTMGLAFSADGKTLATVGETPDLQLHDVSKVTEDVAVPVPLNPASTIAYKGHLPTFVAFLPDKKTLLSGHYDGIVRVWDLGTGQEVKSFGTSVVVQHRYALSADGKTLAVAPDKKGASLWDVGSGQALGKLPGEEPILSLAFSPDGKQLAVGVDNTDAVRVFDVAKRKEIRSLLGKKELPLWSGVGSVGQGVAFGPDNKTVVSLGSHEDDKVRVWDAEAGKELRMMRCPRGDGRVLALSPDGKTAAVAGLNSAIRLWDVTTGKELHAELGRQGRIDSVAVSRDGRLAATGSYDGVVRVYERKTGKEVHVFPTQPHQIGDLAFTPDGKGLYAATAYHPTRLWDLETGKEVRTFPGATGSVRGVYRFALSPDGSRLALLVPEPAVQLVDTADGKLLKRFAEKLSVDRADFSPDGKKLAVGGFEKGLHLYDVASGKEEWVARTGLTIASVAFSPDGKWVATGHYGPAVKLWSVDNGECLRSAGGPAGAARGVRVSPDARLIAAGGDDNDVMLIEAATGTEVCHLKGHTGHVWTLAFSPDGGTLVTGSYDGTGLVWDLTGRAAGKKPAAVTEADLGRYWQALGDEKGAEGYAAVWGFSRAGKAGVAYLEARLSPAAPPDAKTMARLIAQLDSDDFQTREAASAALAKLGRAAEGDLKEALSMKPTPEAKLRIEELLKQLGTAGDPKLRTLRLVTALEYAGLPEARALLEKLADNDPSPDLKREAKAALARMKARPVAPTP